MFKRIAEFDNRVSEYWTNHHFSGRANRILRFYVRLGDGYIWALFIAFLFWRVGLDNFLPILWHALTALAISLRGDSCACILASTGFRMWWVDFCSAF